MAYTSRASQKYCKAFSEKMATIQVWLIISREFNSFFPLMAVQMENMTC
jgi:hypothetical protein